jgi:hypothetical protein
MPGRRPVLAGTRPVDRKATGREPDCPLCQGPISYHQRVTLAPDTFAWAHLGCYAAEMRRRALSPEPWWVQ